VPKFLTNIDLVLNELQNAKLQQLSSDPSNAEALVYYNTTIHAIKFYNGTAWLVLGRLDQLTAPTADVSLNSHKITSRPIRPRLRTPRRRRTSTRSPRGSTGSPPSAATTANGRARHGSFENGDVIDGVTLATNDRILIKNQAPGAENGIYVVAASGAPARATDADTAAEILQAAVFVEEGTANADTGWVLTTNAPITLGTTGLTFTQFTGATVTAGAGLTQTGNTIDAVAASGSGIVVNADNIDLDPTNGVPVNRGGTGAITAAGARANLGVPTKYAANVGDGSGDLDHGHPQPRHEGRSRPTTARPSTRSSPTSATPRPARSPSSSRQRRRRTSTAVW
jgi:hypothetical protein